MRIYDDRYERDRERLHVALRFIRLEARTHTIRQWTGLSDDRIRKLYRSYLAGHDHGVIRHRGKSPQRIGLFLRSSRSRAEAALLASLCRLLGALPTAPAAAIGAAPSLRRAEVLCHAYETYRALISGPLLSFEHAVFLLTSLLRAEEITCGLCEQCHALLVTDRWALRPARCELCAEETARQRAALQPADLRGSQACQR